MTNDETQTFVLRRSSSAVFLTYNILDGGRGREKELFEIITAQNADVIFLQEVAEKKFVVELAACLNANYFIAESNSWRTIAVLSRLPIRDASSFHPRILRHTCLQATLEYAPQKTFSIFGVHLAAPAYTFLVELYRLRELNLILKQMEQARGGKIILAGDFNSIAPGDTTDFSFLPLSLRLSIFLRGGYIARQAIARIRAGGFIDVFRTMNPNEGGYTLPASQPNTRLDYFFVNDALRHYLRACDVVVTPSAVQRASDHLPVRMELDL